MPPLLVRSLAVAAAVVSIAAATPASAEQVTSTDPRRDTTLVNTGIPGNPSIDNDQIDVTSLNINHGARNIRVAVDVVKVRGSGWSVDVLMADPAGNRYVMGYSALSGDTGAYLYGVARRSAPQARGIDCTVPTTQFDRARDRYVLSLPRTCLGNPVWLRFGVVTARRIDDSRLRLDDARRDGEARLGAANSRLGRRVFAG